MKFLITLLLAATLQNIVPPPSKITESKGSFEVNGYIYPPKNTDGDTMDLVSYFATILNLPVNRAPYPSSGIIFQNDKKLGEEAYCIEITRHALKVRASSYRGFLHAYQTICQMLPIGVYDSRRGMKERWTLPCCTIEDSPKYAFRSLMIDVTRHFFSVNEIKRVIRAMSMYKMNVLHLHLSDEQGWRIAIDRYPKLTEIGAWRDETCIGHHLETYDGVRYGGFYTKDEMRELIHYAGRYGIDIMPEIDVPGHAIAAIASYPELSCTGGPLEVRKRWIHTDEALCLGRESTYKWIYGVFDEIAALFPFKYIHIGGDECSTSHWEHCPDCQRKIAELGLRDAPEASKERQLQQHLTNSLASHLRKKKKTIIGWNEIYKATDIDKDAVVMMWNNIDLGRKAATDGHKVIYARAKELYLNQPQSGDLINEPMGSIARKEVTPLRETYMTDPTMGLQGAAAENVIGIQGCLWTEYVDQNWLLEYMLFPRLIAIAEAGWSDPSTRDYDRFTKSLTEHQFPILDALHYPYRGKLWYQKEISLPDDDKSLTTDKITLY